jgi:L-threonylcarbamoyladenylate synthase
VIRLLNGGPCRVGIESTIVAVTGHEELVLLRPGSIGPAALAAAAGVPVALAASRPGNLPRAPGMLAAHYAPHTPLHLVAPAGLAAIIAAAARDDTRLAVLAFGPDPGQDTLVWRQAPGTAAAYAHDLYGNLRALDAAGATRLLVEVPPTAPEWLAVHDRLGRAQAGSADGT